MSELLQNIEGYLIFCKEQRRLDAKTLKAYRIDLHQYCRYVAVRVDDAPLHDHLSGYIVSLHDTYAQRTVKRKIATLKTFYRYLQEHKNLSCDVFSPMKVRFREAKTLPKTIELHNIQTLFSTMYRVCRATTQGYSRRCLIRDIAVVELLLGTGMRISELCSLRRDDIDLISGVIRIHGKGAKERMLAISNSTLTQALKQYQAAYGGGAGGTHFFFENNHGNRLSEQSVRLMIKKHSKTAGISQNITPHMFRHSFATLLLEQDVDIRYIQKMLGHSSISITEIYTYVSSSKQREILHLKNPRNLIAI